MPLVAAGAGGNGPARSPPVPARPPERPRATVLLEVSPGCGAGASPEARGRACNAYIGCNEECQRIAEARSAAGAVGRAAAREGPSAGGWLESGEGREGGEGNGPGQARRDESSSPWRNAFTAISSRSVPVQRITPLTSADSVPGIGAAALVALDADRAPRRCQVVSAGD